PSVASDNIAATKNEPRNPPSPLIPHPSSVIPRPLLWPQRTVLHPASLRIPRNCSGNCSTNLASSGPFWKPSSKRLSSRYFFHDGVCVMRPQKSSQNKTTSRAI